MPEESEKIRITLDDIAQVPDPAPTAAQPARPAPESPQQPQMGPRQWGTIDGAGPAAGAPGVAGSFFLRAWVYLGIAGFSGAFLAWAICEPHFRDYGRPRWGNTLIFPLMTTLMCMGLGAAESIVERSSMKAVMRGLLSLVLGLVLGFIFYFIANVVFNIGLQILVNAGTLDPNNPNLGSPALWLTRSIAWMGFGASAGIVYGIAGQSPKKLLYGMIGGIIGAGIGGLLFDPISMVTGSAGPSRLIGMTIFGTSTGIAMGLVESALKDRWLYVSAGPLAGKQFILYKAVTRLGRDQGNEIYLFKDLTIQPQHATIEMRGAQTLLTANGPTYVGGQPVTQRILRGGDLIQIGRYSFQYQEKLKPK